MTDRTEITLTVGNDDFDFVVDPAVMTKYINSLTPANKVAPGNNLLVNTVVPAQKDKLKPLLGNPMTVLQIAGALVEEYAPTVEVTVKKRSATPND
ncbi:putative phage tail assembly chaperone [Pseudomonas chlororaphis]|uniref:putative phage tail assembly chaperone n=1 Tax=Pseudomonas chlororaphis TaxID=587753 RepID=UPI002368D919|nr:putative phage tail assembly chaperone [Pseudomonas chlororaphis]WDG79991.1 putative phage tail assembly chaperone [Pseudomonas chlororaphis]WDG86956.1 putative phage tail assembly chaperone [Pseudomonas chlororaphis]